MKTNKTLTALLSVVMMFSVAACAKEAKTQNSSEAIAQAKTMDNTEEQAQFLISEANAFVNSQQFDDAIKAARYVLGNLDQNSKEAQDIIAKAQEELKSMADKKMQDMKDKVGI